MRSRKEIKKALEELNAQASELWDITEEQGLHFLPAYFNHLGKIEALEWVLDGREDILTE